MALENGKNIAVEGGWQVSARGWSTVCRMGLPTAGADNEHARQPYPYQNRELARKLKRALRHNDCRQLLTPRRHSALRVHLRTLALKKTVIKLLPQTSLTIVTSSPIPRTEHIMQIM